MTKPREKPFNPDILRVMFDYYDQYGFPPNLREIAAACWISSTSVVRYQLCVMRQQGYVHQPHPERGIWMLTADGHTYVQQQPKAEAV